MPSIYDAILVKGVTRYRRDKRFIKEDAVPATVKEALTTDNMVDENGLIIVDSKSAELNEVSAEDQKALDAEKAKKSETDQEADEPDETETPTPTNDPTTDPDHEVGNTSAPDSPEVGSEADAGDDEEEAPAPRKKAPVKKAKRTDPKFVSRVPQTKAGMGFPRKNGKTVDIFDGETPHTHIKLIGGYTVPLSTDSFNTRTEKEIENRLLELGFELIDYNHKDMQPSDDGLTDERDDDDDDGSLTDDRP